MTTRDAKLQSSNRSLALNIQPDFFRLLRLFSSAKILDGNWLISGITVSDWLIFVEEKKRSKREN